MKIEIRTDSMKELEKFLAMELKKGNENLDRVLGETAKHIQGQAKQLAPVDSGWLRRNIIAKKVGSTYEVITNADYSLWVEYGNRWSRGTSFFRPSIEKGYQFLESRIEQLF